MNKYQLYTIGGALLAASSLSSVADAATAGRFGGTSGATFTAGTAKISNLAFSTTAATANTVVFSGNGLGILFTNQYDNQLASALKINLTAAGATFTGISTTSVNYIIATASTGANITVSGAQLNVAVPPTVSNLGGTLQIGGVIIGSAAQVTFGGINQSVTGAHIVGIELTGQVFNNASGLATVGGTVSLAAVVTDNFGVVYTADNMTSGTPVLTSGLPLATTVTPGTSLSANGNATPAFSNFGTATSLTLTLATVNVTSTGVLGTDLSAVIDADGSATSAGTSSVSVALAGVGALSDPAVTALEVTHATTGALMFTTSTALGFGAYTAASYNTGTVTFTIAAGAAVYDGTWAINTIYNNATTINTAAAGTATISFTAGGSSVLSPAGGSSATAGITHSGLTTQVNFAMDGGVTGFTSYVRIHNSSASAGTAVIVVKKDTTDGSAITTLSTYTTGTIPAGGTVQIGVPTIEAGGTPVITPVAGSSYTLLITGAFAGYVQHLAVTPNSSVVDLDGFRNGGAAAP